MRVSALAQWRTHPQPEQRAAAAVAVSSHSQPRRLRLSSSFIHPHASHVTANSPTLASPLPPSGAQPHTRTHPDAPEHRASRRAALACLNVLQSCNSDPNDK